MKSRLGYSPTTETIWINLRKNKNIERKHREFLYATIRGTYRIGKFWEHANDEEIKNKQYCTHCDKIETMEHILCECLIPGQSQIWEIIRKIWGKTGQTWHTPAFGEIIGISSIDLHKSNPRISEGRARLFQVLISEAAHLIWKLRCDRVLDHDNDRLYWPSRNVIAKATQTRLNIRLRMDCLHADNGKFDKKAIREDLIRGTWEGLLENENTLGTDWIGKNGVLVGSRFFDIWSFD